jgi:hypothetical protein
MKRNGVGYPHVDQVDPNRLVPHASSVFTSGRTQLLRLP